MTAARPAPRSVAAIRRDVADWFRFEYPNRADFGRVGGHRLLADGASSAKLRKSRYIIAATYGLAMPPSRVWIDPDTVGAASHTPRQGWQYIGNVCSWADGCEETCISSTGHYGMGQSAARTWARVLWSRNRSLFLELLHAELAAVNDKARRKARQSRRAVRFAVRLNVTSDVPWHRYVDFAAYRSLVFYDYSKDPRRAEQSPADITASVTRGWSVDDIRDRVARGVRVAVVVPTAEDATATTFAGLPAVNGDDSDARFADPAGVVVLLRVKRPTNGTDVAAIYRGGMVRDTVTGEILAAPIA